MSENTNQKLVLFDRNGKTMCELDRFLPIVPSQSIHLWNADKKESQNVRVLSSGWDIKIENGETVITQNAIVSDISK